MNSFTKGLITGVVISVIFFGLVFGFAFLRRRDKELIEYAEKQQEIEALREDYGGRDPYEFFDIPGVRGTADGATSDFERRRDEAVQRLRNRLAD